MTLKDLGSRSKIKRAKTLAWYPSEVDVSIRPGWFYHETQNDQIKSPIKLLNIYLNSVGRNSLLLLNLPPDRRGVIHEQDIQTLAGWRTILDSLFSKNLIKKAKVRASNAASRHEIKYTIDDNAQTYWTTDKNVDRATLEYQISKKKKIDMLLLQENIRIGQRIEKFNLQAWINANWQIIAEGATVGYKRIIRFPTVRTDCVRINIEKSRLNPTLTNVGLFKMPDELIYLINDKFENKK